MLSLASPHPNAVFTARLAAAERRMHEARAYLDEPKVWFWYFRSSYRAEVHRRQPEYDQGTCKLLQACTAGMN